MFQSIYRYYKGYLKIRITGYSPERFVNLCSKNHIDVRELTFVKDGYECIIDLKDFKKILRLVKKSKTRVRILKKYGLPFFLHRNRKRKPFVIGMAAAMVMLYVLSLFIWDIQFEGNTQYTSETLIKFLRDEGYDHGEKISDIVCEDLEKLLRNEFNNMTWVSARIEGNRLIIQIKENEVISSTIEEGEPCNIVADKDGVITNMITKSGTSQVKVGDTVEKGQILVSGLVELTNDSGETIRIQQVEAQAEITASTVVDYSDTFDMVHEVQYYSGNTKTAYDLGWFNSFIHITPRGTSYDTYDVVTEDGQAVLLFNLDLPLKWKKTVYREYEVAEETYTEEEAKALASANAQKYLDDLAEQGIIIDSYEFSIKFIDGICQVTGRINTTQSLGISAALTGEDEGLEGESAEGENNDGENYDGENDDGENNDGENNNGENNNGQGEVVNLE